MRRVAVLGGGMAGLATAWNLSGEQCRGELEVTVYQRGWRLGGKGASSRGPHGRSEEHGLHVWLGYYDNAFRLLREVYSELDRPHTDPGCPIATWHDALEPVDRVGVADRCGTTWAPWVATFRRNDRRPGLDVTSPGSSSMVGFARQAAALLLDFSASLQAEPSSSQDRVVLSASPTPPWHPASTGAARLTATLRHAQLAAMLVSAEALRQVGPLQAVRETEGALLQLLDAVGHELDAAAGQGAAARRIRVLADLVLACLRGTVRDGLLANPSAFSAIDHLDFREWLALHGASRATLGSPLVRGMYDLVFAYRDGDQRRPQFSAGLGLFLAARFFLDYKGAIFWRLQAGMGDVVFAPMYQALRARGVHFRFFSRVHHLHLTPDGRRVRALTVARQARVKDDAEYDPLIEVAGLPCFPDRPRAEQLVGPVGDDLESHWGDRAEEELVRLDAGEDFDDVVLAVSVGMVPHVCGELLSRSARWRDMVRAVATVPTQALQLWLTEPESGLGWPHEGVTVSGFPQPFDTYASMGHLLTRERWLPDNRPAALAYLCSVLDARVAEDPAAAHDAVRANAIELLRHRASQLWPGATHDDGSFRWDVLFDETSKQGPGRLDAQYWTANTDPSDRYVQSLPGSGALRLRADESGVDNLVLAGDWINCGLNAGCIEAAVMAGREAANTVRGRRLTDGLLGAWYGIEEP